MALFALLMVPFVSASPITIDNFSAPSSAQSISATSGNPTILTTKDSSILGGQRQVMLTVAGAPGAASQSGTLGAGSLDWGSTTGPATTVNLLYAGLNNAGLGGADLTSGGTENGFLFDFGPIAGGPNPTDSNKSTMHLQTHRARGEQGGNLTDGNLNADGRNGIRRAGLHGWVLRVHEPGSFVFQRRRSEHQFRLARTDERQLRARSYRDLVLQGSLGGPVATPLAHAVPEPSSMVMAAMALVGLSGVHPAVSAKRA